MTIDVTTLRLPASQGAIVVALSYLSNAAEASQRLTGETRDPGALHDFRVAIRRLRSWIRAFPNELHDVRSRDLRALRRIARATNAGRDAEVQIDWATKTSGARGRRLKEGAEWVASVLEHRRAASADDSLDVIEMKFPKLRARLESDLGTYASMINTHPDQTLAEAIGGHAITGAHALGRALAEVHAVTDVARAHEARIAAKRLRYVVEPAVPFVSPGDALLSHLKQLQDDFGELHDRHVMAQDLAALADASARLDARRQLDDALGEFAASLPARKNVVLVPAPPGSLPALARRLRRDMDSDFARVRKRWLGGHHAPIDAEVSSFHRELTALAGQ